MFALPFLPADHIPDAFAKLRTKATGPALNAVMQYVEDTWMTSTLWPVSAWSVFGRSVRTNNDVEGWHHRLNRRAKKGNLAFYLLIKLTYKEAEKVPLQVKLVSEGKLIRHQKKKTVWIQGKLFQLWQEYADKTISVSRLLKRCGSVYGPTPSVEM